MSVRQQQVAVFLATVLIIFGLFTAGVWLIAQRLTAEATLQTAVLMARQVEIALADSLRERPSPRPRAAPSPQPSSSFWSFLGNIFPGNSRSSRPSSVTPQPQSRSTEVRGLIRAFIDRSGGIEAMWVVNADGKVLYSSTGSEKTETASEATLKEKVRRETTTINSISDGQSSFYDVWVPLQMPSGVKGPGGLRLWINPSSWTGLVAGMWRQLTLLFILGGAVALVSAFLTTALYTRRFRLIADTLRQAEAGTYQQRPQYGSRDDVAASLDLIDRLVMKQRKTTATPAPVQRLAVAARTLAHEVRTPLNALAIHLEVLRNSFKGADAQPQRSITALDSSIRQVERLVRDFTDYSAPVTMDRKQLELGQVLAASLDAIAAQCAAQKISLTADMPPTPCIVQGDAVRLRQSFDNLLRNAMEAQPNGGMIRVAAGVKDGEVAIDISDSGPGIPPERRAELFEFGKTTKAGGSGIGLPLSQLIAEAHGGSLIYQENNGRGATFSLKLPLEER